MNRRSKLVLCHFSGIDFRLGLRPIGMRQCSNISRSPDTSPWSTSRWISSLSSFFSARMGLGRAISWMRFQLLSRMAISPTLKSAFEPPYRGKPLESFSFDETGDPGPARARIRPVLDPGRCRTFPGDRQSGRPADPGDEASGRGTARSGPGIQRLFVDPEKFLRYRVEVEVLPGSGILRVADEYVAALNAKGEPTGKRRPFLERVK